jgi:hypothetical protein
MALKKSAGLKKPMRAEKATAPAAQPASAGTTAAHGKKNMWTLPIAMLMLAVAASGLWIAMRDTSNRTQAATPAATNAVMSPDGGNKAPAKPTDAVLPSAKPAAATATAGSTAPVKPVSITGCLARNDRGFMLKDTEGADVPKSRSWKSGFMRRSASSVALTDTSNAAHLADHVGQRVSVTGPLAEREMNVTSLRRVAASCQ